MGPIGFAFVSLIAGIILGIAQHYICKQTENQRSRWILPGIVLFADAVFYIYMIVYSLLHHLTLEWALFGIAIYSCLPVLATSGTFIGWYMYNINK